MITNKSNIKPLAYLITSTLLFLYEFYFSHFSMIIYWILENQSLLLPEFLIFFVVNLIFIVKEAFKQVKLKSKAEGASKNFFHSQVESIIEEYENKSEEITSRSELERLKLARDLHDDTIHQMILISQQVELMMFDHPENILYNKLTKLSNIINNAISNTRGFIKELRPPLLQTIGLLNTLKSLTEQKAKVADIVIDFSTEGTQSTLKDEVEMTLYRLSQTALQNIVLHAEATHAALKIAFKPNEVMLSIIDNGKGFDVPDEEQLYKNESFGLLGMRERTHLCGGIFTIHSVIDSGTHIIIKIPKQ